jgi:hypothetical protein
MVASFKPLRAYTIPKPGAGAPFDGPSGAEWTDAQADLAAVLAESSASTSKLANMPGLNVKDFGAVGDGVATTLNELAAFEAAYLESAGEQKIIVPAGIYNFADFTLTAGNSLYLELDPRAELRMPAGTNLDELFNFTLGDGDEVIIRGGILNGNRHNKTGGANPYTVRPYMIRASVPDGALLDIEGVGYKAFDIGLRVDDFGGEVNYSQCRFKDQGQHRAFATSLLTCLLYLTSGDPTVTDAQLTTNGNKAVFTDAETSAGTAPGGFFVDTKGPGTYPIADATFINWTAIQNDIYGYGQNKNSNEIGVFHAYPKVGKAIHAFNRVRQCRAAAFNIKGGSDYLNAYNQIYTDVISSAFPTQAGLIHIAPGFHAEDFQNYRAMVTHAIIYSTGGTASQGVYGISVEGANNPEGLSPARDVFTDHNQIFTTGIGLFLNYVESLKSTSDKIVSLAGTSSLKRGVSFSAVSGPIAFVDVDIDAEQAGIIASGVLNTGARVTIDGGSIKTPSGFGCVDVRGVAFLNATGGLNLRRVGGGSAFTVAQDASANQVLKFFLDESVTFEEGTANFVWAQITAFAGTIPPRATSGRPAATAVAVGTRYYDTTLGKPVWSNGTAWRDAAGTAV